MRKLRCLTAAAILGLSVTAAAAHAASLPSLTPKTMRYWTAIAACETGGGGPPKWDWGSKHRPSEGTLFEGGVGFSAFMWKVWAAELGIVTQYPHAYDAPSLVQMEVAQYGVNVHHAAWGCKG